MILFPHGDTDGATRPRGRLSLARDDSGFRLNSGRSLSATSADVVGSE